MHYSNKIKKTKGFLLALGSIITSCEGIKQNGQIISNPNQKKVLTPYRIHLRDVASHTYTMEIPFYIKEETFEQQLYFAKEAHIEYICYKSDKINAKKVGILLRALPFLKSLALVTADGQSISELDLSSGNDYDNRKQQFFAELYRYTYEKHLKQQIKNADQVHIQARKELLDNHAFFMVKEENNTKYVILHPYAQDQCGNTALHWILSWWIQEGRSFNCRGTRYVEVLLENGANIHQPNNDGITASNLFRTLHCKINDSSEDPSFDKVLDLFIKLNRRFR